jgi:lipopolysaccharide transport system permease protein
MPADTSSVEMPLGSSTGTREEWTATITPHRGWTDWRLGQLWRYRDLITLFVWRDFVAVYKQTILGPAWHIIQPLLTTLTFTLVFGKLAKLSTDGAPPFLFYLAGMVPWSYFSSSLSKTAHTFVGNAHLMGKVYFHRLVIPVSVILSNLISFGIQLGIFLVALGYHYFKGANVHLTSWIFLSPLCLLMLAGYGLGGGIIVSALTTRYRDLANLVTFGVQLLMYATPVIYPASAVPEQYRWITQLNPLTPILEGFRLGFLGTGSVNIDQLAISFGGMVIVLTIGLMLFTHIERSFTDTV